MQAFRLSWHATPEDPPQDPQQVLHRGLNVIFQDTAEVRAACYAVSNKLHLHGMTHSTYFVAAHERLYDTLLKSHAAEAVDKQISWMQAWQAIHTEQ